jgi:transcription antitermination factor NusG
MPILQQQPAFYPPTLLSNSPDADFDFKAKDQWESPRTWWAVYTRSRQEKSLARRLYVNQVPFYLPLVSHEHVYRGRRIKAYIPLFSNYMFLFGTEDERVAALTTNSVSRMLPVVDRKLLFHDLLNLHQLIDSGAPMTVEQRLESGRAVRIKTGSLKGVEGTVLQRRGGNRLLVAVNYIQLGVSLAIEDFMLEPI